jgi:hypothetical protein
LVCWKGAFVGRRVRVELQKYLLGPQLSWAELLNGIGSHDCGFGERQVKLFAISKFQKSRMHQPHLGPLFLRLVAGVAGQSLM